METYYIYRHIRLDNNTPFYIGKGKGNRAHIKSNRNKYWKNIVDSSGYEVEIILDNLTEEAAFTKEIEFIALYKGLGYCEANLTNGGEGSTGAIQSDETKTKLSIIFKGKKRGPVSTATWLKMSTIKKGKVVSEETKAKIRATILAKKSTN